MSNNYETMGFAFTHQGLKEYEKSIDNHIFYPCRCYAHAGEKFGREAGDFYPIMEFLHSAGEQLLVDDLMAIKIGPCPKCGNTTFIATAHVTQTWLVDEDGDFIEAKSDCDEVTHAPDAEDLFTCSKCGEEVTAINV